MQFANTAPKKRIWGHEKGSQLLSLGFTALPMPSLRWWEPRVYSKSSGEHPGWRGEGWAPSLTPTAEPVGDRAVNMFPLLSGDKTLRAPHGRANKQRKEQKKRDRMESWNFLCFRDLKSIMWRSHHMDTRHQRWLAGQRVPRCHTERLWLWLWSCWWPSVDTRQPSFPSRMGLSTLKYLQPGCPHLSRWLWALPDSD